MRTRWYGMMAGVPLATLLWTGTASAALLGLASTLQNPVINYNNQGTLAYDAASDRLTVNGGPALINIDNTFYRIQVGPAGRALVIDIRVDATGALIGGSAGPDLVITGAIDINRDGVYDYQGELLTGEISQFGYLNGGIFLDDYDFRFIPTGGALLPLYQGKDIGVTLASEQSTFDGSFQVSFTGEAKGNVGALSPTPRATLGDRVWEDRNGNSLQDDGEPGVAGVSVALYNCDGTFQQSTTTGADGGYLFSNLAPGSYYVVFTPTGDYRFTGRDQGDEALDSDANLTTGRTDCVELQAGEVYLDLDAGLYLPASLGNFVWLDLDRDGLQDGNEPGVAGVTVTLTRSGDNGFVGTTTTNGNGSYLFTGLAPGSYEVTFTAPGGLEFTLANQAGNDQIDSDAGSNGQSGPIVLVSGQEDLSWDAGLVEPATAQVGDYVWEDLNGDGLQSDGTGLDGVTVSLYQCLAGQPQGNPLDTTTTGNGGAYLFDNLAPGTYAVRFTAPAGYRFTAPNQGANDSLDSDAGSSGYTPCFDLAVDESNLTLDAGLYRPARLGDYVWFDTNRNGLQDEGPGAGVDGVTVRLVDADQNPVFDIDGNPVADQQTSGGGFYLFDNLLPGQYRVQFVAPADRIFTSPDQGADDGLDSDAGANGFTAIIDLASGEDDRNWDAGLVTPATAQVGDRVWLDGNGNGLQDDGEPGQPGVSVTLYRCEGGVPVTDNGLPMGTTTTDGDGLYLFESLPPGSYGVQFDLPAGYFFTGQDQGDDQSDSDADPADGYTGCFDLAIGQSDLSRDAGLYQRAALGDYLWLDDNRDGLQNDGPNAGVAGVTVNLLDGMDNLLETTVTDASGYYRFDDLVPGTYRVEFVLPVDRQFTLVNQNGDDALDSDADPATGRTGSIELSSGEEDLTWDAGLVVPEAPAIHIEKATNGHDADAPTGPYIPVGDTVIWTYGVTNTGNVALADVTVTDNIPGVDPVFVSGDDDNDGLLDTTETWTFEAVGEAVAGQYANIGTVTGRSPQDRTVSDSDPSHYFGKLPPGIRIEKATNGHDADTPTGPYVAVGGTVTWTYVVTNTGNVALSDVTVSDDQGVVPVFMSGDANGNGLLEPTETWTYQATGTAVAGQYANLGTVTGKTPEGSPVDDTDPSHYFGAEPGIHIEKATNGEDADQPTGPELTVGGTVTWTYGVTNTGNVALSQVNVVDDDPQVNPAFVGGDANGNGLLDTDETWTYQASGSAVEGQYQNTATVTGRSPDDRQVSDDDPSHYIGRLPRAAIGDFVWNDLDGDGVQDANEPGVAGVTVKLLDGSGNQLASQQTGSDGGYLFDDLAPGDYRLVFEPPQGYGFTGQDQGGNDALDSDADPATGQSVITTLDPGETDPSWDAGLVTEGICLPSIDFDTDANGRSLAAGTLIDDEWAALGVHVTTHDPVRYPAMIFDTGSPTGGDWDLGTPNRDFGGPGVGSGGSAGSPGENRLAQNKVLIISEDRDSSDPDDKAGGGRLIFTFDQPVQLEEVHILDIDVGSAGQVIALDGAGNVVASRSLLNLGDNSFQVVSLQARGVTRLEVRFADSGAVAKLVFCPGGGGSGDGNNGGQGCTPGYWRQSQHYGNWPAPYTPSTAFGAVFEDAFPGKTLGQVVQLGGGGLNALGRHTVAALLNGASQGVSYDLTARAVIDGFNAVYPNGDYETLKDRYADYNEQGCPLGNAPVSGALGDRVWKDLNGNGQQDTGEPGIAGVNLILARDGQELATTTTDSNGLYGFNDLDGGSYTVTVDSDTLPAGLVATHDLDGLGSLDTATAALASGQVRLDLDFGYTGAGNLLGSCKAAILSGQITGSITADGKGYLTNHTGQAFLVGMASYKKFDEVYANQELFDGNTTVIAPGQSLQLQVATPDCAAQLDLFCGTVQESLSEALYGTRLIKALHTGGTHYCGNGTSQPDLGTLPDGLTGKDIGHVGAQGTSGQKDGQFTVKASGGDIWGNADAFHFVYQPWEGDVVLKARVTGLDWTDGWAKAGLMIRNDLTPGSRHAMMVLTPGNGAAFQYRKVNDNGSYHTSGGSASAPLWVKLKREGQTLIGYRSSDGQNWQEVGRQTIDMGQKVYVGLATTSHAKGQLTQATFQHYSVQAPQGGVLLVVGEARLNGGDAKVKARLEALGLKVTVRDDDQVASGDANGRQLVVISSTVLSGKVGARFRDARVPVVLWESHLYDDMKMTGSSSGSDYGSQSSQYKVYLTDWRSHLQTTSAYQPFSWGKPASGAIKVAMVAGSSSKASVFAYDQGAWMKGMQAPARRVALFLGDDTATRLTDGGWKVFDWAIQWAQQ